MRHTEVTPEEVATDATLQDRLDHFWDLIEDKYEEEWRQEYSGAIVLNVDHALLERILRANHEEAQRYFDTYEEHSPEYQKYEWVDFPEDLIGLYSIEGVYTHKLHLITRESQKRTYFFEQGY